MSGHSYSLFSGDSGNLIVGFDGADDALAYMARNADELKDGSAALLVFDDKGMCQIALVDARSTNRGETL